MTFSTVLTVAFVLVYFFVALRLIRGLRITTRELCTAGVVIAMTMVLESIRIPLPTGATISLFSPVPLLLLALLWDRRLAIVSGWICGVLAVVLLPVWQPVHWGQFFVEHLVCFSCLGLAGVFGYSPRWRAVAGILLASAVKLMGHILSGVLFFSQNAWDGWGSWGYSLTYNLSENVPLCILSAIVVLCMPLAAIARTIGGKKP